ncbi:TetR family transcriptional regulator C-terminal domain-containing protein [Roseibium sp. RKSG952]|uniref:TetR family transcriptional regulator C-terminal domain-containing protein n=1 Tax=Roseibium sp. RKSG952 TaxID=2529384 RepID=UPI0012BC4DD0|nr:TetR family transcriptional regulator C-terminal domain-containing protein [Roseibium sp. RKSG952]MTH96997.1 TetR family transcriptional regulator [Roseibium sp. RKSG952]
MSAFELADTPVNLSRIQEKNRALIIEAALGEFSRYGFSGATIEKISRAAGMSKSNMLYYFPSKTAVYDAVLAHILDVWLAPLRTLDRDGHPAEELAGYIHQKMRLSAELPDASRLFANEVMQGAPRIMPVLSGDLKHLVDDKAEVIQSWIDDGRIEAISPIHLIFTIWAMTQHYADFASQINAISGSGLEDEEFRDEATATVCRLVLKGLGLDDPDQETV